MGLEHRQQGLGRLLHGEGGRDGRGREASGGQATAAVLVRGGDSGEIWGNVDTALPGLADGLGKTVRGGASQV